MKCIIYIGDFEASFSTERYVKYALQELGYDVRAFQDSGLYVGSNNSKIIADDIESYSPEFVLFSKNRFNGHSDLLINELNKRGVKTVVWLFDLFIGLTQQREDRVRNRTYPFNCQIVFSTDGGHQKEFQEYGVNHKVLRQGIHKPEAIMLKSETKTPIIFVGSDSFGTRENMFIALKSRYGTMFRIFGDKPKTSVRGLELNILFSNARIVIGDSQPSPRYWSNRIYETLGRGGFLIHPEVEGLEEEFEAGTHFVSYKYGDYEELLKKVDYYLEHDEEREKIRKAGHEYCKKNYTYTERCKDLIRQIC